MARELPQPHLTYEASEVMTLFGYSTTEAVMHAVASGKFPRPIRANRQTPPLWSGRVLRAWMRILPHLEDAPPPTKSGPPEKKMQKSSTELEGTEG